MESIYKVLTHKQEYSYYNSHPHTCAYIQWKEPSFLRYHDTTHINTAFQKRLVFGKSQGSKYKWKEIAGQWNLVDYGTYYIKPKLFMITQNEYYLEGSNPGTGYVFNI